MRRYRSEGFKSVLAESDRAAAEIFAGRLARREYGKKGYGAANQRYEGGSDYALWSMDIGYTEGNYKQGFWHTVGRVNIRIEF